MPPRTRTKAITIHVSPEGLELLREYDFPCSEAVLATATVTRHGVRLTGTRLDMESLVGWVAGEANHSREKRRGRLAEMFDEIADELEAALGG